MAQANLSVRIDENDKKSFEVFCNETGMNVSVAINMFIKTVLREHKLPFEIKADPFYSKSNMSYLENIVKDINDGVAKLEEHDLIEDDIQRNSFEGIGKPEPLKENLTGYWSRRIDDTNRIVYTIKERKNNYSSL